MEGAQSSQEAAYPRPKSRLIYPQLKLISQVIHSSPLLAYLIITDPNRSDSAKSIRSQIDGLIGEGDKRLA
eukprot:scaffold109802_cov91-Cyclotella_meneghiniana.AAC.1